MPRKRKPENKGLPARWRFVRNAYYFQVPPGCEHHWDGKQTFRLGASLHEAYSTWATRLPSNEKLNTFSQLFDRYLREVSPFKAPATQASDIRDAKHLRKVFDNMPITLLKPSDVYKYFDTRSKKVKNKKSKSVGGATSARHEVAFLSKVCTKAVQWGCINSHPFKGEVILEGAGPRSRYIEDWEIIECLNLSSPRKKGSVKAIQTYIKIKLLTGMTKGDLLRLKPAVHFTNEGIQITRRKTKRSTGKTTIYEWTSDLKSLIEEAKALRPVHISPFLFCTNEGNGYYNETTGASSGWDSMWDRFMLKVLEKTKVKERFTEHDLRAKCASDAETIEHARALLSHVDSKVTNRIYRRKPEKVRPLR